MAFGLTPATQLRLRRSLRQYARKTRESWDQFVSEFDRSFIGRFNRLKKVKRMSLGWLLLAVLLIAITALQTIHLSTAYQREQPAPGGVYREGMTGFFSTANPIYATGAVDTAISRLVFAGLFDYDSENALRPALAEKYSVNDTGKVYTVTLRQNLTWHDGKPLTADDVVYTFKTVQNIDVHSPYAASMSGVEVTKKDDHTVLFSLNSALAAFPTSLTMGIVPQHVLGTIPAAQLRTSPFNTLQPVGAGPFKWQQLQMPHTDDTSGKSATISLAKFDHFFRGSPKLDQFVVHIYDTTAALQEAFDHREVNAMAGLRSLPAHADKKTNLTLYDFQSTAQTMVFLNTQNTVLSTPEVRKGLVLATDRQAIVKALSRSLRIVREPVLIGTFAFDAQYASPLYNKAEAIKVLDGAGWKPGADGVRAKDGKRLEFRLYAEDTPDNKIVTDALKKQWKEVGAELILTTQPSMYLQTNIEARNYDALLYSISVGTDPDVYAYWHSSQANNKGMNFSMYKSSAADKSLEAGRTRQDPIQRAARYKPFLEAWRNDAPAVPLFRPRIYYVTRGPVYGLDERTINTDADRYYSADQWMIVTRMVSDY